MTRLTPSQRLEIVSRRRKGEEIASLTKRFNVSVSTVYGLVKRAEERGSSIDLSDRPRRGRPSVVTNEIQAKIKKMARGGSSASQIAKHLREKEGQQLSRGTVIRCLEGGAHPLAPGRPARKERPGVHLSAVNRAKRLEFVRRHKPSKARPWAFLDAKVLALRGADEDSPWREGGVWHRVDEPTPWVQVEDKVLGAFLVGAAVAKGWKSSLFIVPLPTLSGGDPLLPSRPTRVKFEHCHYQALLKGLEEELRDNFQEKKYWIVRDNAAPWHSPSSSSTAGDPEEEEPLDLPLLKGFPPQSPDLNVMKQVFARLKHIMRLRRPRSRRGYLTVIRESWGEIGQEEIDAMVDSMPGRLREVEEKGGAWLTRYKYLKALWRVAGRTNVPFDEEISS